jgi:two-component system sensor histidine kinase PilS (NtrC family)
VNVLEARAFRRIAWARLAAVAPLAAGVTLLPSDLLPARHTDVLVIALVAAALSSGGLLVLGPPARLQRVAWLVCFLDVAIVTAVVAATGGARSIFVFLYVLLVMAACLLLSRTGALAVAACASLLYAGLVVGRTMFPLSLFFEAPGDTMALELLTIFLNTATLLVVGVVAGSLAAQFGATRTELERERRDLREVQAFSDVLFHSVGAGLIALDRRHTITAVNRAIEAMTGFEAGTVVGRPWSTLFADPLPLDATAALLTDRARTTPRHETSLRRVDDDSVPVRVTFSVLHSADGRPLGMLAVCEDLSEIREMEARMREADRMATLGRMAANIAHEIRNPLASMSGAVEALARDLVAIDERQRLADIVLLESDRLNAIIRNFLDYARPAPLALVHVDIAQTIDDVLVLLEHRDLPPGLKVVRDFPPSLAWRVDGQQFRQALWNVCLNAVEAMPDGGELRVSARIVDDALQVVVADTGTGIETAAMPHVFEPFFSTKPGGSGLGLALVHRIVRDHGGTIEMVATPGGGTSVVMLLPGPRS